MLRRRCEPNDEGCLSYRWHTQFILRVISVIRLKIKEAIDTQKDMNMSKLSRKADIAYNTVMTLCKDPYHDVALSTLQKIANALDVSIFELIEEIGE
jgi:DNA-binding Xre family transcriptional regulator